ncbi:MAG: GNAT family N-acetyltransferase [bacterium]
MKIILETERTILRAWESSDLDDYAKIMSDPLVLKYLPSLPPDYAKTKIDSRAEQQKNLGFCLWAVVLKENNKLIGHCGLQHIWNTKDVEIGYALAAPYWGMGLATEIAQASLNYGFKTLGLKEIIAVVFPDNPRSRHVLEKIGMKFVGTTDKYYDKKGLLLFEAKAPI